MNQWIERLRRLVGLPCHHSWERTIRRVSFNGQVVEMAADRCVRCGKIEGAGIMPDGCAYSQGSRNGQGGVVRTGSRVGKP